MVMTPVRLALGLAKCYRLIRKLGLVLGTDFVVITLKSCHMPAAPCKHVHRRTCSGQHVAHMCRGLWEVVDQSRAVAPSVRHTAASMALLSATSAMASLASFTSCCISVKALHACTDRHCCQPTRSSAHTHSDRLLLSSPVLVHTYTGRHQRHLTHACAHTYTQTLSPFHLLVCTPPLQNMSSKYGPLLHRSHTCNTQTRHTDQQ